MDYSIDNSEKLYFGRTKRPHCHTCMCADEVHAKTKVTVIESPKPPPCPPPNIEIKTCTCECPPKNDCKPTLKFGYDCERPPRNDGKPTLKFDCDCERPPRNDCKPTVKIECDCEGPPRDDCKQTVKIDCDCKRPPRNDCKPTLQVDCGRPTKCTCDCGRPTKCSCDCGRPAKCTCDCGRPSKYNCDCGRPTKCNCNCGRFIKVNCGQQVETKCVHHVGCACVRPYVVKVEEKIGDLNRCTMSPTKVERSVTYEHKCGNLENWFRRFDFDCDGLLDLFELRTMLNYMGLKAQNEYCQHLLDCADRDGDGRLSFSEFMLMWQLAKKEEELFRLVKEHGFYPEVMQVEYKTQIQPPRAQMADIAKGKCAHPRCCESTTKVFQKDNPLDVEMKIPRDNEDKFPIFSSHR